MKSSNYKLIKKCRETEDRKRQEGGRERERKIDKKGESTQQKSETEFWATERKTELYCRIPLRVGEGFITHRITKILK